MPSTSKKQACHADLRHRILTLDLAPGADLDEARLSEFYGLSRTPLREVFQRLAGEGYVELAAHRGAAVSAMDMMAMRRFFQTAPVIYCAVVRLAAEQATPAQVEALRNAQDRFREAQTGGDPSRMALANHRFHEIIGDMAANPYLAPSLGRLLIDHTRMSHAFYTARSARDDARIGTAADQHDQIIDAIEQRDPGRAVDLTLAHWSLSRDEIEKYVWPDPLPDDAAAAGGLA